MAKEVQDFYVKGIITAPCTPFKKNGEVDYDKFENYVSHIEQYQNTCVFANGTTGEGLSLTMEERKKAAEKWKILCEGRLQLIINVSCTNVRDACELARHSEEIGVDAISAHSPIFYTPQNIGVLVDCLKVIAAAAPNTPFYYYDINFKTGISFDNGEVVKQLIKEIPTFRGIKQSSREIGYMITSIMNDLDGKYQVITGNEGQFNPVLKYNYTKHGIFMEKAPFVRKRCYSQLLCYWKSDFSGMVEAFDRGDMQAALREQKAIQRIQLILKKYGEAGKRAMSTLLGMDVGLPRLPMNALSREQLDAMEEDLSLYAIKNLL